MDSPEYGENNDKTVRKEQPKREEEQKEPRQKTVDDFVLEFEKIREEAKRRDQELFRVSKFNFINKIINRLVDHF